MEVRFLYVVWYPRVLTYRISYATSWPSLSVLVLRPRRFCSLSRTDLPTEHSDPLSSSISSVLLYGNYVFMIACIKRVYSRIRMWDNS
jgi:hypothetical protein